MKCLCIIFLSFLNIHQEGQELYLCKNAKITLFSSALIEDIKAVSPVGVSVYNASTGELDFSVAISSFKFDKAFMQQHFNSDYMESDKYPKAIFKGKIQEHIDITKEGTYPVSATGELTVHGVVQKRTVLFIPVLVPLPGVGTCHTSHPAQYARPGAWDGQYNG